MTHMKVKYLGDLRTECTHLNSGVQVRTEAPQEVGGTGKSFSPTDLLAVSLASCMITLMGILAQKLGFDFSGATADVEKEMATSPQRRIGKLIVRIRCLRSPDKQTREKLEKAALSCPVHLSLHPDIKQEIDFIWGV
ncbi:MAG: OsmC family protein [Chlamydiia bacterium]|nr:OsmC family protein [Chlamydiia bacterium]